MGRLRFAVISMLAIGVVGCKSAGEQPASEPEATQAPAEAEPGVEPVTPLQTAQNRAEHISRGSVTGQATAKGYSNPAQYMHLQGELPAPNMEPVIPHPEQEQEARSKLRALREKTGKRPNMLLILLDDVGYMDPGFTGGGVAVGNATPEMDRLANEGLILTSAYSTPSCTPTRATIHTGQNPLHHGLLRPPMYGEPGGLDGAVTMPAILQKLGYRTQGVGKWHMGENRGSLPQNVGYDDYYGFLGVSDMYTEWRDQYFNPEIALSPERFAMMEKQKFSKANVHCTPQNRDDCEEKYTIDLGTISGLDNDWAEYSENFIKTMSGSDKPWYLVHNTRGCHFDNYPNDEFAGRSAGRTVYTDCMVEMDSVVARLTKALRESGQLENTLIIFTTDNGPECEVPPHGRTPFRGCKGSSWEGGTRVPTFVYWKGMIESRRSDGLFDLADIFNTFVSLAGDEGGAAIAKHVDKKRYVDGVDQVSFLLADNGYSNRRSRIYTLNQFVSAVRIDEFKYSAIVETQGSIFQRGYTGGFSGSIVTDTGGTLMVNLYSNPQEDVSIGVRHIPALMPLYAEYARYGKVLSEYPPQLKIGFAGGNSKLYD